MVKVFMLTSTLRCCNQHGFHIFKVSSKLLPLMKRRNNNWNSNLPVKSCMLMLE